MTVYYNTYSLSGKAALPTTAAYYPIGGCTFNGYISGTTLTVTALLIATQPVVLNSQIVDSNIIWGTKILSQTSGTTGGVGVYTISISQNYGTAATPKTNIAAAVSWDYYVDSGSNIFWATPGVGPSKGKPAWNSYTADSNATPIKAYIPGVVIGSGKPPIAPSLSGNVITPTKTAVINNNYSYDIVTAYGGSGVVGTTSANTPVINFTVTPALPSWLTIAAARGVTVNPDPNANSSLSFYNYLTLTATITNPTSSDIATATNYNFTVTFSDNGNFSYTTVQSIQKSFSITLSSGAATLTASVDHATNNLIEYSAISPALIPVSARGGNNPIKYALTSGALPSGLSFNPDNGEITGVPTEIISSPRSYVVTITDYYKSTATGSFTIAVNAPQPVITVITASKQLTQLVADSYTAVTATGGYGTLTFSMKSTTLLPSGLSITTTNVISGNGIYSAIISGTPSGSSAATTYTIVVTDTNLVPQTATQDITITVNALTSLKANQTIATLNLPLNTPIVTGILPVTANPTGYGTLSYSIDKTLPHGLSFNTATGGITGTPDTLSGSSTYNVTISDQANTPSSNSFILSVTVTDITLTVNSLANSYTNTIAIPTPGYFTPISGTGGYGTLHYAITPDISTIGLTFDTTTGRISGTPSSGSLDVASTYKVTITDSLSPNPQTKFDFFNLTIKSPPSLTANQPIPSSSLVTGTAYNIIPVVGYGGYGTLTYTLRNANDSASATLPQGLSFSTTTGAITGTADALTTSTVYTVAVTDSFTTPQRATNTFSLSVSYPALTVKTNYATSTLTVTVNFTAFVPYQGQGGGNGVTATTYTYSLTNSNGSAATLTAYGLTFSTSTGTISAITGSTPTSKTTGAVNYNIIITDNVGQTQTRSFALTINDPYAIPIVAKIERATIQLTRGLNSGNIAPISATGGNTALTYTLRNAGNTASATLPASLSFNTTTGQITGTATENSSATTYFVLVTDTRGQSDGKQFQLSVVDPPALHLITTPPGTLTKNATASFTPVTVDPAYPGIPPYTYTVKTGTLQSGLTLGLSTGLISGTPTVSSVVSIIITVADSDSQTTDSDPFNITVANATALTTSQDYAINVKDQKVQITPFVPVSASGGYGTLTYTLRNAGNTANASIPTGLNFSTTTGSISGTPTVYDTGVTYTVVVTDQAQQSSYKTFQLRISPPALNVTVNTGASQLTRLVQTSEIFILKVSDGYPSYTYALFETGTTTPATLPSGLTFYTNTGSITGTPQSTLTATSYDIRVTDSFSTSVTNTYSLTVNDVTGLNTTLVNSSLTFYRLTAITPIVPVTATGGYGTISFGINPSISSLGLTFNPLNGLITGTPTILHTVSSYTITATDSVSQSSSKSFTIEVLYPPLVVTPVNPSYSFTKNLAITSFQSVTVTGGTGNYPTFAISPTLVSGLSFTTLGPKAGTISGTPTANDNTTYTVTVTDSNGTVATATFNITVTDAPTVVATPGPDLLSSAAVLTLGTAFSPFTPVVGSGGGGTLSYSITPALPSGLYFNPVNGLINGTPTALSETASPTYGPISYTVRIDDQVGQYDSIGFTLIVVPKPLVANTAIPSITYTTYQQAIEYIPVTYTGGLEKVKFSISPDITSYQSATNGLRFDTDYGKISGTPTLQQNKTEFTITVTDSYGGKGYSSTPGPQTSTAKFTLEVLFLSPTKLTALIQNSIASSKAGVDFSGIIPVTTKQGESGYGTLVYSITDANGNPTTLPTAVTFDTTNGALNGSGLVTTAATIYTVTITDAVPQTTSAKFSLEILSNNPTPGLGYTGSRGYWGSVGYTGSSGAATYRGYTGSVGFAGSRGAYDAIGFTGSDGYWGSVGYTGSRGIGFTGSAGYVGSASTIVGYAGSRGFVGYTGSDGAYAGIGYTGSASTEVGYTGSVGDPGPPGGTGGRGDPGEAGFTGSVGFTGSQGIDGAYAGMGYTGSQGDKGYSGSVGFSGSRGVAGYSGSASTIPGYAGSEGTAGFTGSQGADGAYAAVGFTGSQGDRGYWGSRGYSGSVGIGFTGSASTVVGPQGYWGSQGDIGWTGSRGIPGFVGSASTVIGYSGSIGFTGSRGAYDAIGFTGSQGDKGYSGSQGVGFTGSIGSGYTGSASTVRGYTGSLGYSGSRGAYDAVGFTGSFGDTGYVGSLGRTGGSFRYIAEQGAGSSASGNYRVPYINCLQFDNSDATQVGLIEVNCLDLFSSLTPNFFTNVVNSVTNDIKGQLYISSDTYSTVYNVTGSTTYITLGLSSNFTYVRIPVSYVSGYTGIFGGAAVDVTFVPYGQQGYTGSVGFVGSASTVIGFSGSVGDKGFTGSRGAYDAVGFTGSTGGLGYSGSVGFTGSQGVGFTGSASTVAGYTGSVGYAGSRGAYDAVGFTGSEGIGYAGSVGRTGGGFQYVAQVGAGTAGSGNYRVAYYNSLQINNDNATLATVIEINCLDLFNTYTPTFFTNSINSVSGPIRGYLYISSDSYLTVYKVTANASLIVVAGTGDTLDYTRLTVAYLSGYSGIFDGSIVNVTYVPYGQIGYSGSVGFTGSASTVIGFSGSQGPIGFTGSDGAYAAIGFTGSQGNLGYSGSLGYWGSRGYSGSVGFVGSASTVIGFTGSFGDTGYTGSVGFVGSASTVRGFTGSWGYFGSAGYTGSSGAYAGKGYTGSKGYSSYYYSDTPPTDPLIAGDRWFNIDVGLELIWVDDGSSSQWIEVVASGGVGYTGYTGSASTALGYTGSKPSTMALNAQTSSYTLQGDDDTKLVSITTGGIIVPLNVFNAGQTVTIFNNSIYTQILTQGAGVTMYFVGTVNTGNRSLAPHGLATVVCVDNNTFVITGGGLS